MYFREFIRWASNEGWSRAELFGLARMWWRRHPDDKGDTGVFQVVYQGYALAKEFRSRRAAVQWALWNYKGSHVGWQVRPVGFEHLGEPYVPCPLCAA